MLILLIIDNIILIIHGQLMKVQVKYFANIKDLMGKDTEDIKDMNSITVLSLIHI